ncbi:hydrolase [Vibrio brasiliensis]|uniref:Isochorismatase hydrolase n=1 Tax=Vibrio brasiliensis LMG 20546 TaxID=945543 RepID=E8LRS8_9VIBR|nr:hydrolase [Vibrio brasiliensis]EGA66681.1 isochorismatase hydrolase [Vibrio brasiliensis LMG 20546]
MLDRTNTGLVIVDVQGKLASLVHDSDTLIANCAKLTQGAQLLGLPIVWLEQNPEKLGPTVDSVRQLLKDVTPISKFTFNGCGEPEFVEAVRQANVENFLLCGIEAHICVYQTALALAQRDYDVHLVTDCISSRLEQNKQLSVRKLLNKGIDITCLEMCLYELVKDCRSDEFRSILKLIK